MKVQVFFKGVKLSDDEKIRRGIEMVYGEEDVPFIFCNDDYIIHKNCNMKEAIVKGIELYGKCAENDTFIQVDHGLIVEVFY